MSATGGVSVIGLSCEMAGPGCEGASDPEVRERLGHSPIGFTTNTDAHVPDESRRRTVSLTDG